MELFAQRVLMVSVGMLMARLILMERALMLRMFSALWVIRAIRPSPLLGVAPVGYVTD